MDKRIQVIYCPLVFTQAIHAVEEYLAGFYRLFPPAQWIARCLPSAPRPGFIVFSALFVLFWAVAFLRWVSPGRPAGRAFVWALAGVELYNGLAHLAWAALVGGYNPGLVSAVPLLLLGGYAVVLLRRGLLREGMVTIRGGSDG